MSWVREYEYVQGKDYRWQRYGITARGACQALSIYWIIKGANGEDFMTWLQAPLVASSDSGLAVTASNADVEQKIVRVMQQQDKVFNTINGDRTLNMKWASDKICHHGEYGNTQMTPYGALVQGQASAEQLAAEVVKRNGYKAIGWYLNNWGGHLTAAYVRNNETWFFDPNLGQYKFSDKQSFMTWFKHSLFCSNYGIYGATTIAEIQHYH